MAPIRKGDGTPLEIPGVSEVRSGDGRVFFDAIRDILQPQSDDLQHFSGDTDHADINDNEPVLTTEPTNLSLKLFGSDGFGFAGSTSGLEFYPETDSTSRLFYRPEEPNMIAQIYYSHSSDFNSREMGYAVRINTDDNVVEIWEVDDGFDVIGSESITTSANETVEIEILHESNGDINVDVIDTEDDVIGSVTANSSKFLIDGEFEHEGIGFELNRNSDVTIDWWRLVN